MDVGGKRQCVDEESEWTWEVSVSALVRSRSGRGR